MSQTSFSRESTESGRQKRLAYLESRGLAPGILAQADLTTDQVKSNVENFFTTVSIPVGLVGPLLMKDEGEARELHAPIATTEGALVASINRGAKAISLSGGFDAHVVHKRMLRAPTYSFASMRDAARFAQWVETRFDAIKATAETYSRHAKLLRIDHRVAGKETHLKFFYETGDAAGQNMTTTCTWHACLWIEKHFNEENPDRQIVEFVLEGNTTADKKISFASLHEGRGSWVVAETFLKEEFIESILKSNSDQMLRWFARSQSATTLNGLIGAGINVANLIAGVFTATGQDIASVHESSVGVLHLERAEGGLYVCLQLPRLVIGTVGGGTGLPRQSALLALTGCKGKGKVDEFAKLIAGFALSLEISTLTAMVSGQFALAHERLGRNRPVKQLDERELVALVQGQVLGGARAMPIKRLDDRNGILTQMAREGTQKPVGFTLWKDTGTQIPKRIMVKSKAMDRDLLGSMTKLTGLLDPSLSKDFAVYAPRSEFTGCHVRESEVYARLRAGGFDRMPKFYGSYHDAETELYLLAQEYLEPSEQELLDSENEPDRWTDEAVRDALSAVTDAQHILRRDPPESVHRAETDAILRFSERAIRVLEGERNASPELIRALRECREFLASDEVAPQADLLRTVVHGDFNPRNVVRGKSGEVRIYDWELASHQYPQRDWIEFCSFLDAERGFRLYREHADRPEHYARLREEWGLTAEEIARVRTYAERKAFALYMLTRVTFYLLGNELTEYPFMERVSGNVLHFHERLMRAGSRVAAEV